MLPMTKSPAVISQVRGGIVLDEVIHDLRTTSDRGAAIIGGGLVEWCVERMIFTRLRVRDDATMQTLTSRDGALQTFYGKIHLAYAMGAYGSGIKVQLEAVRRIRNLFAHQMRRLDFETNEVVIEVRKLGIPEGEAHGSSDLSELRKQFNLFCIVFFAETALKESGRMMRALNAAGVETPDELKLTLINLMEHELPLPGITGQQSCGRVASRQAMELVGYA
jgi:hypothetical protein